MFEESHIYNKITNILVNYLMHSLVKDSISDEGIVSTLEASGYFTFILSTAQVQIAFNFSSLVGLQVFIKAERTLGSVQLTVEEQLKNKVKEANAIALV